MEGAAGQDWAAQTDFTVPGVTPAGVMPEGSGTPMDGYTQQPPTEAGMPWGWIAGGLALLVGGATAVVVLFKGGDEPKI